MKILHLLAHTNLDQSRVNKIWAQQLRDSGKVATSRDLYADYPDFRIDVEREQAYLVAHDRVIFQFPFHWYSIPSLLKKWLDDVLTYGFAYGRTGNALRDKELQLIVSIGGPTEGYMPGGINNYTIHELLRPIQQTAYCCQMKYLPVMLMHRANVASEEVIRRHGDLWISKIDNPDRSDPNVEADDFYKEMEAFVAASAAE